MPVSISKAILSVTGQFSEFVGSLRTGPERNRLLDELAKANIKLEKISEDIFYSPAVREIENARDDINTVMGDIRELKNQLEPVARTLNQCIVTSDMLATPDKMGELMKANPWSVLDNIRPVTLVTPHSNPEMLPVMFEYEGTRYIGWQMKGAVQNLFDIKCDIDYVSSSPSVDHQFIESAVSNGIVNTSRAVKPGAPNIITSKLSKSEDFAYAKLSKGGSKSDVVNNLVRNGMSEKVANGLVSEMSKQFRRK